MSGSAEMFSSSTYCLYDRVLPCARIFSQPLENTVTCELFYPKLPLGNAIASQGHFCPGVVEGRSIYAWSRPFNLMFSFTQAGGDGCPFR